MSERQQQKDAKEAARGQSWRCPVHGKVNTALRVWVNGHGYRTHCQLCISDLFTRYGAPDIPEWTEPASDPEGEERIG